MKVYLSGFKPLLHVSGINTFTFTGVNDINLILGTNGSGKSSIIREATPFPADAQDYRLNGEKRVIAEFQNSVYELISYLGKSPKYTVIRDGEIVLDLVNATVQREWVIKEFNYTPYLHKILTGELRFCKMKPPQRREVLMLISPLDLQYALKLQSEIKEQLRDKQAIVKHISNKLADSKIMLSRLNIPEDTEMLKLELEKELERLLPYALKKLTPSVEIKSKLDQLNIQLNETISERKINIPSESKLKYGNCTSSLLNEIGIHKGIVIQTQEQIHALSDEIIRLTEVMEDLADLPTYNNTIEEQRNELRLRCNELIINLDTQLVYSQNIPNYLTELSSLENNLHHVYGNMSKIHVYTKEERDGIRELNNAQQIFLSLSQSKLNKLQSRKQHLEDTSQHTTCPKCNTYFNISGKESAMGIDEIDKLIKDIEGERVIKLLEADTVTKQSEEISIYELLVNDILNLKKHSILPHIFWEELKGISTILGNKISTLNIVEKWITSLQQYEQLIIMQVEMKRIEKVIEIQSVHGVNVSIRLKNLQKNIKLLIQKKQDEEQIIKDVTTLNRIEAYNKMFSRSSTLIESINAGYKDLINSTLHEDACSKQTEVYNRLGTYTHLLTQRDNLDTHISELTLEYDKTLIELKAFQLLEENISQSKGLIAEQMVGFIGSCVSEINVISNKIWEYSIDVQNCQLDNGVLNYIFPVMVEQELVPDLSKLSTSQADIINLAFAMVVRQYLGLTDYPFYMDETGASFDTAHRKRLMDYVTEIVQNKACSQLFIINHYANVYGGLSNHSVIVLDDRNITVPLKYNENVVITYE
jgi:DNA repair exonuclease SbcCD ATPase subunit